MEKRTTKQSVIFAKKIYHHITKISDNKNLCHTLKKIIEENKGTKFQSKN